ncbi:MAG: SIS domain-containing protein, partial [Candidatus Marinimicrobia bacterium]|nr:SIS domain-containing protein [Candidatus Neomarinimicrobiota bacterium]
VRMKGMLMEVKACGNKTIIAGNGGSAAMASHVAVDFTKQAGIRTINFNEADLITCFANDYGYENWVSRAIEFYGDKGDVAILISSSGSSVNMVNAANTASKFGMQVITFTGFNEDNPLKQSGDLNFWIDSRAYNVVENTHQIWLLLVCDLIIGKAEYPA